MRTYARYADVCVSTPVIDGSSQAGMGPERVFLVVHDRTSCSRQPENRSYFTILAIGSFWNKNYAIQNLTAGDVYSTDCCC
jgi:hypothetical protein